MSGQIFISYRREDSSAWSGRLSDYFGNHFPSNQIFMDVDSVDLGEDFVKTIEKTVGSCDVLIAVIGKSWLTSCDAEGQHRLENPEDFVRLEVATALKRGIRVIPVLVDGASMPRSGDLPDDLKALTRRNALQLGHDRFRTDSERLKSAVERALEQTAAERGESKEKERLEVKQTEKERSEPERTQRDQQERPEHGTQAQPPSPVTPIAPSKHLGKSNLRPLAGIITLLALAIGLGVVTAMYFISHPSKPPTQEESKPPSVTPAPPLVVATPSPASVATPNVDLSPPKVQVPRLIGMDFDQAVQRLSQDHLLGQKAGTVNVSSDKPPDLVVEQSPPPGQIVEPNSAVRLIVSVPRSLGTVTELTVWKVGSPHTGEIPSRVVPPDLESEARQLFVHLVVETFPADGFATKFFEAFEKHEAPDILQIDNHGIITGITTARGKFEGLDTNQRVAESLIAVTGSLKSFEGPSGGWEFLITTSRNYEAAKSLALRLPDCDASAMDSISPLTDDLNRIAGRIAADYRKSAGAELKRYEDAACLYTEAPTRGDVQIGAIRTCGYWGNGHLAFVPVILTFQEETTLGRVPVLLIFRKQSTEWKLLTAATDPISTGRFMAGIPRLVNLLNKQWNPEDNPASAKLLAPEDGQFPQPPPGQRFGDFVWQPSTSSNVVAEIVEFKYLNDARLFLRFRSDQTLAKDQISTGSLWTTRSEWKWRVWSISDAGVVSMSESRSFRN